MAITRPCYSSREDVARALDSKLTARNFAQIDRAIEAAAVAIEGLTHRRFYPKVDTRYFDWPNDQYARSWRLWLQQHELVSVTTLTIGGTVIAAADYFLRPYDGPPYTRLEIDLDSSSAFGPAAGGTHQRAVSILGVYGYSADDAVAGTTAEALDASETGVDVTDSALIGVGDLIKVESERMLVTGKTMLDTAVNIDAADSLTAAANDVSITMSTTTNAPVVDEVILIDSERMLVVDVAGSVLTVKRAWDGTVLAAHSASADIYAGRTLTVVRGSVGTTAVSHSTSIVVTKHIVPPLVRDLSIAEALTTLLQEGSGYARTAGSGENEREVSGRGVRGLRDDVYTAHGRKARISAI